MDDILAELRKIPPVTRFMVVSSVAVSLPVMMHMLSGYSVVYTAKYVFGQGQVSLSETIFNKQALSSLWGRYGGYGHLGSSDVSGFLAFWYSWRQ